MHNKCMGLYGNLAQKRANLHNQYYLKPANKNLNVCKTLRFCKWNAESVRNKTALIQDYLCHEKIDLCAITESWMKTNRMGHTLDLIITREENILIQTTPISHCFLSDHSTVLCNMTLRKPAFSVKKLSYRKIKAINIAVFEEDLLRSDLCGDALWELDELVICYNDSCSTILDRHAPLIRKTVTVRPRVPWFNDNIKAAKRERRKYERIWKSLGPRV